MITSRVWFITGASRGLGRAFTEAALAAGDEVVAVARNIEPLASLATRHPDQLHPLSLDVTDRQAVFDGVDAAVTAFGRPDIVVNNAGGMLYGMVEEATEAQIRAHLDLNFFGAVWVAQAVLPHLRAGGGGRLLQVTSMGSGGGMATVGFYGAGKAAPVILELVALPDPPRRLIVGSQSFDHVLEMDRARDRGYHEWEHLSRQAPG
ncbi:SDR family NAD(P)-dependent oxidoreductase [Gordonia hongkongensis]|uniref:SDR family NAD(P)-dependent oxidoreductase n=2 Tax=Gordonia TaxID=2053 RepID=A0AAX3T3M1_9ACTN|nr:MULTISPECIES: SDR family NAD(P)-dependent oxidoreductase [Gordonia]MCT1356035.1 SDR family NAD(P)-dependent oxidoreductase [Gordonia sp. p3-SID1431]QIK47231.1 SDR family NAD(P)-dependent oxidoreductase [Gordonia terrae]WFP23736.1 SDR family NAD(P)-dependent oxidoreductase [Gordonia hongkongensis]